MINLIITFSIRPTWALQVLSRIQGKSAPTRGHYPSTVNSSNAQDKSLKRKYWRCRNERLAGHPRPCEAFELAPTWRKNPSFYVFWPFEFHTKWRHLWSINGKANVQVDANIDRFPDGWRRKNCNVSPLPPPLMQLIGSQQKWKNPGAKQNIIPVWKFWPKLLSKYTLFLWEFCLQCVEKESILS